MSKSRLSASTRSVGVGLMLVLLVSATPAWAHRAIVFALAEGNTILVEAKLVPNTPVKEGQVVVSDKQSGKVLVTGQTDAQGKFSFPIPAEAAAQRSDLLIVVEAGLGHKGEWLLKAEKYLPGSASAAPSPAPAASPAAAPTEPAVAAKPMDTKALEEAVGRAVARELAPVKEMLTELTVHRTSLTDIIGGLGYIMGIFGIWAYFLSRRQGKS